MNMFHGTDKRMQYDYLRNSIRKRKRFSKWMKNKNPDDLEVVKEYFGYSNRKAKDALSWLILMKEELGHDWLQPDLFRFGASSLLAEIERQLEHFITGRYSAYLRHPMA